MNPGAVSKFCTGVTEWAPRVVVIKSGSGRLAELLGSGNALLNVNARSALNGVTRLSKTQLFGPVSLLVAGINSRNDMILSGRRRQLHFKLARLYQYPRPIIPPPQPRPTVPRKPPNDGKWGCSDPGHSQAGVELHNLP
ncbi:hypothetical protein MJO28_013074 [Puccinia striiformis f. sp. tritici]|uniref:Uncharacterized protein n=4 Tax=Puccinia striiformis TaxID=27350 RepID=A0A0L0UYT8_9BASI|nr:hypothetical protein MJO28_013074 [Puccinia striiformis f. sp. tritici]KAI7943156.1 hypothetical protein MJO29_013000 [Puccinia striiformis f. sp. tritici]KNE92071.1 hypothetical protein PSTG_14546 [Puccinia striiformis f. sp. tritici PST-78]POV98201.1 hypothetical protein PSHT_14133 [Puccinia striiformis]